MKPTIEITCINHPENKSKFLNENDRYIGYGFFDCYDCPGTAISVNDCREYRTDKDLRKLVNISGEEHD